MKLARILSLGAALLLMALPVAVAQAPAGHTVVLTWQETDTTSGITFNAYRANGACGTTGQTFASVKTGITADTYSDAGTNGAGVPAGVYCYQVTAVANSAESAPSNPAGATIAPLAPSGFTVKVQ